MRVNLSALILWLAIVLVVVLVAAGPLPPWAVLALLVLAPLLVLTVTQEQRR